MTAPDATARLNAALDSRYRIERELGEGGMATVYLADDLKHERKVALKVLKPELAAVVGAERFLAEIKTTANLQHPHILPLHDSGSADGLLFYVMPFVDGESLRERLDRERQLPVADALGIVADLADALDYAHAHGVIHRDVKPANLLIQSGRALIADFGIALAVTSGGGSRLTETGLSLGTPHYMSPEQATGDQDVGPATDTYALGCVLYEMLVGEPPFTGSTPQAVLGKILTERPASVTAQRRTVPAHVDEAIATALAPVPADRFRTAGAFSLALRQPGRAFAPVPGGTPRGARTWKRLAIAGFATAATLLLAFGWSWTGRGEVGQGPVIRSAIEPPVGVYPLPNTGFQLSPDGSRLAYVATDTLGARKIWIQALDALGGRALEGTDGASFPFWSPDGGHLGFFTPGNLKRIPVGGGTAQVLAPTSLSQPKGGTWGADGRIVYGPDYRTGLFEVAEDGGEPRALTSLSADDGELSHRWPHFLPDGEGLIFLVQTAEYGAADDRSRIEMLDTRGQRHPILRENSSAAFASPGGLLFWRGGAIYAQDFDPRRGDLQGTPVLVTEGVGFNTSEWGTFSISGEGTLAYHVGTDLPWQLEWRDRSGRVMSIEASDGDYSYLDLSPDGTRVAYRQDVASLWVQDLVRGTRTRLTFEEADHYSPAWSPDGEWVAYSADKAPGPGADVFRRRSSGVGDRERLYEGASDELIQDVTWSPDGRWIGFESRGDITLLDVDTRETRVGVATPGYDYLMRFSPDGRWMVYVSDESGREELYVVSLAGGGKWVVTSGGGSLPQWSASGDEIYFMSVTLEIKVVTVTVTADGTPDFAAPETLFRVAPGWAGQEFDIAPDGRVLLRTHPGSGNSQNFRLIQNWSGLREQRGG